VREGGAAKTTCRGLRLVRALAVWNRYVFLYRIIYVYVYSVCFKLNQILVCPKNYIIYFAFILSHTRDVHNESVGKAITVFKISLYFF